MKKLFFYIFHLSILKTIRFNLHYFGFKGLKPKVLVARNVALKKLKGNVSITKNSKKCHIGFSTNYIYCGAKLKTTFYNEGNIAINGNLCVSRGCSIVVKKEGKLEFGNDVHISQKTQIECHKSIILSDNSIIAWDCLIIDSDTHPIYTLDGELINGNREIIIGSGSWICCRNIILKGAYVPKDSILAAGQIYNKKLYDDNVMIAGNRVVKRDFTINMEDDIL